MNDQPQTSPRGASQAQFRARPERVAIGKALRQQIPREDHAHWQPRGDRRDPIAVLEESNHDRLPELIPIRYGRMLRSPFTFLRGSAALMAYDLATTPSIGVQVQACGDCHLLNFGLFATPERNLVFDLNDFDETHPAPWEWDLKRLVTSVVVAGRENDLDDAASAAAVRDCVRSYRQHLREYSHMSPLEVWYSRLDMESIIAMAPDAEGLEDYRQTLSDERRVLFDRYRFEDAAVKVVGIGSVGTRCLIGLFFSEDNHPLILQVKEVRRSVLEPYTEASHYDNQGQRVVMGQRLTQSSSDIFLGWVRGRRGRDFYVRQLRDMKMSFPLERVAAVQLSRYSEYCGWTLARAHAKSGDGARISGYLGKGDKFDRALGQFALAYADQTVRDHAALVDAVNTGRVEALVEED